MNRIYRIVWNAVAGTWVVASELARGRKKASSATALVATMAAVSMSPALLSATDYIQPVFVISGQKLVLNSDTVTVVGDGLVGIASFDTGSLLSANSVVVSTNGTNTPGALASDGGSIMLLGGSISTAGSSGADAVMAQGIGSHVDAKAMSLDTTGDDSYGASAMNGASVTFDNVKVTTAGLGAVGLYSDGTNAASSLTASYSSIKTTGQYGVGLMATQGGLLSFSDGQILTTGLSANGAFLDGAGSTLSLSSTSLHTLGDQSHGVEVGNGATVNLTGGTILTEGAGAFGLLVRNDATASLTDQVVNTQGSGSAALLANNAVVNATNGVFSTVGANAVGVAGIANATVNLSGGSINVSGQGAIGLAGYDNSSLNASNLTIQTSGEDSASGVGAYGVDAEKGTYIALGDNTAITTSGTRAVGLFSLNGASLISTTGQVMVRTAGDSAYGALAQDGGALEIGQGTVVETAGAHAAGLFSLNGGSQISTNGNVQVSTTGDSAYGALAQDGGTLMLEQGVAISTSGTDAVGLFALDSGSQITTMGAARIATTGDRAYGLLAQGGGVLTLAQGTTVATAGTNAPGAVVLGAGSQVNAIGTTITTAGAQADGLVLANATANLTDSTVTGQHHGVLLSWDGSMPVNNVLDVSGGKIASVTGDAIHVAAGNNNTINVSHGAQIVGGNGTLLNAAAIGTAVDLSATDNVVLAGDVAAIPSAVANVSLSQASSLTGAMHNASNVSVDGSSRWNLTSNSDVRQLNLAGTIAIAAPSPNYKSLAVHGDLNGNGGTIALNTTLNAGGALSNQFTDRVLVEGSASGTTYLAVTGSGSGALTDANGNGVLEANEGISLAQVAGASTVSSFVLPGGYVAVGPWRYNLVAYQPGSSDAGQRVVSGSGNGYWDYRLQSAVIPDPTPTPTPDPTPTPNPTPDPVPTPPPTPNPDPTPAPRPEVVPQVPAYLSASTAMLSYGLRNVGTLHDRLGEIHGDVVTAPGNTDEFYARVFGGNYQYHSNRSFDQFGYGFDQNDRGIQIGGTWLRMDGDKSTFRLGMYGSTGTSHITPQAIDGSSAMRMNASSVAATGTYVHGSGFYLDGVVARNYYSTRVDTAYRGYDMATMKTHGWTYSLEGGYPFVFGNNVRMEPQAQVIYQSLKTSDFNDADGLRVASQNTGAWLGRVGANVGKTFVTGSGQRWSPWMRVNYLWSSGSASKVTVASDAWGVSNTFTSGSWGQAWQMGAGITGALTPAVSVYANADYQIDAGGAGEQGWSAGMGARWQF